MPTEEWRPVPGFPDYEASSLGNIASLKTGERRILSGGTTDTGYRNVLLYKDGTRVGRRVHQLIALTFLGPRPAGLVIRHLDGNQLNNAVGNIAYGTIEENVADRRRHQGLLLIVGVDPIPRLLQEHRQLSRCRSGHERTEANTYIYPSGRWCCRLCKTRNETESRRRRTLRAAAVAA